MLTAEGIASATAADVASEGTHYDGSNSLEWHTTGHAVHSHFAVNFLLCNAFPEAMLQAGKSSSDSYYDVCLVQHAAHQHGITHDSQLGSMLYAEDLNSVLDSNTTAANSTIQALSQHETDPEVPLMTDHTTTFDPVSSRSSSRRELPTRTHHQAHQTAELP